MTTPAAAHLTGTTDLPMATLPASSTNCPRPKFARRLLAGIGAGLFLMVWLMISLLVAMFFSAFYAVLSITLAGFGRLRRNAQPRDVPGD